MFAKMSIILETLNISRFTVLQGLTDCTFCFNNNTHIQLGWVERMLFSCLPLLCSLWSHMQFVPYDANTAHVPMQVLGGWGKKTLVSYCLLIQA